MVEWPTWNLKGKKQKICWSSNKENDKVTLPMFLFFFPIDYCPTAPAQFLSNKNPSSNLYLFS